MKTNWTQILIFTLLALVLGFVLGRVTGPKGHHGDRAEKRIIKKYLGDDDKNVWQDDEGEIEIMIEEVGDSDMMSGIVKALEEVGFEGDTIIDGATISINRNGDEVSVEVKKEVEKGGS